MSCCLEDILVFNCGIFFNKDSNDLEVSFAASESLFCEIDSEFLLWNWSIVVKSHHKHPVLTHSTSPRQNHISAIQLLDRDVHLN